MLAGILYLYKVHHVSSIPNMSTGGGCKWWILKCSTTIPHNANTQHIQHFALVLFFRGVKGVGYILVTNKADQPEIQLKVVHDVKVQLSPTIYSNGAKPGPERTCNHRDQRGHILPNGGTLCNDMYICNNHQRMNVAYRSSKAKN